jgi:hypothetical protein
VIETVAPEEQGFTGRPCERVSKTIAEVQFGGISAAFSKIAIGLARNSRLGLGHRLDDDLCLPDKIVKTPASDGVVTPVNYEGGFYEVGRREATAIGEIVALLATHSVKTGAAGVSSLAQTILEARG